MEIKTGSIDGSIYKTVLSLLICATLVLIPAVTEAAGIPLLVLRVQGKDFDLAMQGMKDELEEEFAINEMVIDKGTESDEIEKKISAVNPKIVVLIDNIAISKYKKFQAEFGNTGVPVVCLMASFMNLAIKDMQNATGIFYEVPVVTSAVHLRSVLKNTPLGKIGVIHREFMGPLIEMNRIYCEKEKIDLVSYSIPNKRNFKSIIKKGLEKLYKDHDIDALWVTNDSSLINRKLMKSVWLPFAKRFEKPIIVGVEVLVNPKLDFGTFAVIPDPKESGAQAAEMVFDIMENDWKVVENIVAPPQSVFKILNLKRAVELSDVDEEKLETINKILK